MGHGDEDFEPDSSHDSLSEKESGFRESERYLIKFSLSFYHYL